MLCLGLLLLGRGSLQLVELALRYASRLLRVEVGLLLIVDEVLRIVLRRLEGVEGSGSFDQFLVLARQAGSLPDRQPVSERFAGVRIRLLGSLKPERCLFQRTIGGLLSRFCLSDRCPQRSGLPLVDEVGISKVLLDPAAGRPLRGRPG